MAFVRSFQEKQITALTDTKNAELYGLIKNDILTGDVFPAIRKNEIYFYFEGGCLYKFSNGKFTRDSAFCKYGSPSENPCEYAAAKQQNATKYTNAKGTDTERRLLNRLYSHTFTPNQRFRVVVLDIEINLNGTIGKGKKCDLLLYNTLSRELMFVEGKVFSDNRVNRICGGTPQVIQQVQTYSAAIAEQKQTIIEQYGNYVRLINKIFGTAYALPEKLVQPAKLLVYNTPHLLTDNNRYSIDTVTNILGANQILWCRHNEQPSTDEIWNRLCK